MDWKAILRTFAHGALSAATVGATVQIQSGKPVTSGNVLLPALFAGLLGGLHAISPSTLTPVDPNAPGQGPGGQQ